MDQYLIPALFAAVAIITFAKMRRNNSIASPSKSTLVSHKIDSGNFMLNDTMGKVTKEQGASAEKTIQNIAQEGDDEAEVPAGEILAKDSMEMVSDFSQFLEQKEPGVFRSSIVSNLESKYKMGESRNGVQSSKSPSPTKQAQSRSPMSPPKQPQLIELEMSPNKSAFQKVTQQQPQEQQGNPRNYVKHESPISDEGAPSGTRIRLSNSPTLSMASSIQSGDRGKFGKALKAVSMLYKDKIITSAQRSVLKALILDQDPDVLIAVE